MKKVLFTFALLALFTAGAVAQTIFAEEIQLPAGFTPERVIMPPSPLTLQVVFVGGHDIVETTPTYGNPAGRAIAKEWHDFIGFTPDLTGESLGWVSVNHEMIYHNDRIGDGGGMTVFKVERDDITGLLNVVDQKLEDGRKGQFFNVDFVNTVGETGMNCGGISSWFDGRIWTAEEWFRTSNASIFNGNVSTSSLPIRPSTFGVGNLGVRDTTDFVVESDIDGWDGTTLKKFQNFNWMVEIDPKQAKAIRKQYNWGRAGWEGGSIGADNRTVYLGPDATPGYWIKFVADKPGDFTEGDLYVYKHDAEDRWVKIDNSDKDILLDLSPECTRLGGTMYNRIEWTAIDVKTGKIYWTETGRDRPGNAWADDQANGGVFDPAHVARATAQGVASPADPAYTDYYGRVWVYDPLTNYNSVVIEGGPDWNEEVSPSENAYFENHLSSPDGLNVMEIDGQSFLIIQEDLNGTSFGRVPAGVSNRTCEMYLLNLAIENPTHEDLIRLSAVPAGAEITGCMPTPDGKSLLVNSQHPRASLEFPWNHSLTFALHGFDRLKVEDLSDENPFRANLPAVDAEKADAEKAFSVFPNPTTRTLFLNKTTDVAIYDIMGKRLKVLQQVNRVDVSELAKGMYFVQSAEGEMVQIAIQ